MKIDFNYNLYPGFTVSYDQVENTSIFLQIPWYFNIMLIY